MRYWKWGNTMNTRQNAKLTYKMYKKGRFWVFAGIAVAAWNANLIVGQAATAEDTTHTTVASKTTGTSDLNQKAVTLSHSATTQNASSSEETDSSSLSATKAETTGTTTTDQVGTTTTQRTANDSVVETSETYKAENRDGSSVESTTDKQVASKTDVTKSVAKPIDSAASKAETVASVPNTPATTDSNETASTTTQSTVAAESNSHSLVETPNKAATDTVAKPAMQKFSTRSSLKAAAAVTVTDSGMWGTSPWTLTSDGVLTIGAGIMDDSYVPWGQADTNNKYVRDKVKKFVIEPGVVAGPGLSHAFFKNVQSPDYVPLDGGIVGLENLDVSKTTDFDFMFAGSRITDLSGIANWLVGENNATKMNFMFMDVAATEIPVSNWNVSKVVDFSQMFKQDKALKTLDLSKWQMGKAAPVAYSLKDTNSLSSITLGPGTRLKSGAYTVGIPAVSTSGYTGKWISKTDGKTYTSDELMMLYSDQSTAIPSAVTTYVWEALPSASTIEVKDTTIVAGPTASWQVKDNVTGLKNAAGQDILATADLNQAITVDGEVNTKKAGVYHVTLNYVDDVKTKRTAKVTVTVVASQAALVGKPVTVNQGAKTWDVKEAIDAAQSLDAEGKPLSAAELAKVTSSHLDTSKAGDQTVTLTYVDAAGNTKTTEVTVHVAASQAALKVKDVTVIKGSQADWHLNDHLVSATDSSGKTITDLSALDVQADKTPDLSTVGTQPITLTYTDNMGNQHTYTVNVNVVANGADFSVKPITVTAGPNTTWTVADSLDTLTDLEGQAVTDLSQVKLTVDRQPNLTKAGTETVVITYVDAAGYKHQQTAMIKVVASQAQINVKDSDIVMGPNTTWQAKDNLTSVIQANGDQVSADDIVLKDDVKMAAKVMSIMYSYLRTDGTTVTVTGNVDLSQPGENEITYTYTDSQGNTTTATALVRVVETQASLDAADATVIQGPNASFNAQDQIMTLTDATGHAIEASAVEIGGDRVDLSKAGSYKVTYHYVDAAGNVFDKTITVDVVKSQAALKVKNSHLTVGDNWQASDNLVQLVDAQGKEVKLSQAMVTGKVDPTTAGTYAVTYHYTDAAGNIFTETATITVTKPDVNGGGNGGQPDGGQNPGQPTPGNNGNNGNSDQQKPDDNGNGDTLNPKPIPSNPSLGPDSDQPDNSGEHGNTVNSGTPSQSGDSSVVTDSQTMASGQADTIKPNSTATNVLFTKPAATGTVESGTQALPKTNETRHKTTMVGSLLLALTGLTGLFGLIRKRRHED